MKKTMLLLLVLWGGGNLFAQTELKYKWNEDGSHYVKLTFLNQTWLRFNQSNPGTTVNGDARPNTFDIGLRRTRIQLYSQLNDRVFIYTQFGQNNFNYLSVRKTGAFFHDITVEYSPVISRLSIGGGLTGWTGFSRFSSPAAGAIMGIDAPLVAQATNDVNDQFLRKMSVYAKGKLGRLDYRLVLSQPFSVQTGAFGNLPLTTNASFSDKAPHLQTSGYFSWEFMDRESNILPYMTGTYLGKKSVFNIGAGFEYQPDASWNLRNGIVGSDTVMNNMLLASVDVFYDKPINKEKNTALSIYGAFYYLNYGPGYIRNLGVMNPANGLTTGLGSFNGAGNAFPLMGTGQAGYVQVGYLLSDKLLGENKGQLMPYASVYYAAYERLNTNMALYNAGVNWLIKGHNGKITLDFQSRPVYDQVSLKQSSRKSAVTMQYQVFF